MLVLIEHITKWVELVPLHDKSAAGTTRALVEYILTRMVTLAEAIIEQGLKCRGEFQDVLPTSRLTVVVLPLANTLKQMGCPEG